MFSEADHAIAAPSWECGAAVGDFTGNGKLDIVVTALGAPAELWMNDSPGDNHWIGLALTGTKSNRDAIGAKVKITWAANRSGIT